MPLVSHDPRPLRPLRRFGRAGRRRALLLGPPCGRRRAGRQGRAAGGRFRPALRRLRQRRERLFRLAQPRQGIGRARPQGRGRPGAPRRDGGAGRRVHPEPRARRRRPPRLRARRAAPCQPAPDHLLDLGLRRRGAVSRPQGLRSLGAGRDRPLHRHRNAHGMARVGVSVCDIAAGMTAFQGILQALIGRSRTGEGRHVAVSLYHALADWMNVPYLQYVYGGHTPVRSGLNHPTIAPYGDYVCQDGKAVLFSIQNETEWRMLCAHVLGRPEIADDPRFATNPQRVENRPALDAVIDGVFSAAPRVEIIARMEKARIAYGRVSTLDDLKAHPQNRTVEIETPAGPVRILAPGMIFDGALPALGPVPGVGEHTDAVRAEFGGRALPREPLSRTGPVRER